MIPKRIFFFWGNDQMSWCRYMTLYSFRQLHPDWEMILYTSECLPTHKPWRKEHNELDFFAWSGENCIGKLKELDIEIRSWDLSQNTIVPSNDRPNLAPSHKCDLLEWCKLYEEGGIYSDMDILYVRSIEPFWNHLNQHKASGCISCHEGKFAIGWMASAPGNTFFRDVFRAALRSYRPNRYQSTGAVAVYSMFGFGPHTSRPQVLIEQVKAAYPDEKFARLPIEYFYYFRKPNIDKIWQEPFDLPESVLGIHWYGGYPMSQGWNNVLNESNWNKHNNIFTSMCAPLLKSESL